MFICILCLTACSRSMQAKACRSLLLVEYLFLTKSHDGCSLELRSTIPAHLRTVSPGLVCLSSVCSSVPLLTASRLIMVAPRGALVSHVARRCDTALGRDRGNRGKGFALAHRSRVRAQKDTTVAAARITAWVLLYFAGFQRLHHHLRTCALGSTRELAKPRKSLRRVGKRGRGGQLGGNPPKREELLKHDPLSQGRRSRH